MNTRLRKMSETVGALYRRGFRTLCAELPVPLFLWDGRRTEGPRRVRRMIEGWVESEALRSESETVYAHYKGGDFIDVGAAEGWFACLLAPKAQEGDTFVLCEPDPRALPRLHKNVSFLAKEFPRVRFMVFPLALGDGSSCEVRFPMGLDGNASFLSQGTESGGATSWKVDDLVAAFRVRPCLIKVDVEGAEGRVLAGAESVISEMVTAVALEVHPKFLPEGTSAIDVERQMESFNMRRVHCREDGISLREIWVRV